MAVNVGTGKPISLIELAEILIELFGSKLRPYVSGEYRKGDVRHCYTDIQRMHRLLNFKPTINLRGGLTELMVWAKTHRWEAADLFNKPWMSSGKEDLPPIYSRLKEKQS